MKKNEYYAVIFYNGKKTHSCFGLDVSTLDLLRNVLDFLAIEYDVYSFVEEKRL